jgi:hypothetical protein
MEADKRIRLTREVDNYDDDHNFVVLIRWFDS